MFTTYTVTEQLAITEPYKHILCVWRYRLRLQSQQYGTALTDDGSSFSEYSGHNLCCYNADGRYALRLPQTATKESTIRRRCSMQIFRTKSKY